eukprot:15469365-Alexandrium_andersonii.AAC.1
MVTSGSSAMTPSSVWDGDFQQAAAAGAGRKQLLESTPVVSSPRQTALQCGRPGRMGVSMWCPE